MNPLKGLIVAATGIFFVGTVFYGSIESRNRVETNESAYRQSEDNQPGKDVYETHCLACHQGDGSGVASMYPPLADNPRVLGQKDRLIEIILDGQEGRIEVKGKHYNGVMPSYEFLSDNDVADLLTYIRQDFGNDTTAVSPAEVRSVRDSLQAGKK